MVASQAESRCSEPGSRGKSGKTRSGTIVLECQIVSLHKRNHVLTEYSVSVLSCV